MTAPNLRDRRFGAGWWIEVVVMSLVMGLAFLAGCGIYVAFGGNLAPALWVGFWASAQSYTIGRWIERSNGCT